MEPTEIELITLRREELERFLVHLHWAANRFTKYTVNAVVRRFADDHELNYLEIRRAGDKL